MNGRVAKRLRRVASNLTTGRPLAEYNTQPVPSVRHKMSERTELIPECTRALYQDLKTEYKKNIS